jgi:hypothetical protein
MTDKLWDPGPLMMSKSPEHYTPAHIVNQVVEVLDAIDLDPCADPRRLVPAATHYTKDDDGLAYRWAGRVYMNPPYGRDILTWVGKLNESYRDGEVTEAIALLPARTDTRWMRVLAEYPRCYLWGRLKFGDAKNSAPFPSVLVYLGKWEEKFVDVFSKVGDCYVRA